MAEFGLNQHLVPLLVRKENEQGDILVQVSMLKGMLLACECLGMFFFVHWQGYSHGLKMLVFVLGIGVGMDALASSFFVAFQVEGHQALEGKIRAMGATLGFGYGLTLLFVGAAPLIVAFYKIVETAANLAGVLFTSAGRACLRFRLPRIRHIWTTGRGSIVFTLMAIAAILYNKANIFFLQRFGGPTDVAQYMATWQMVDGISILTANLLLKNILFPLFVKLWETDRVELARLVRNSTEWLLAAALPIMFVLFIESDRLIGLIYGPAYGDAVWMQKYPRAYHRHRIPAQPCRLSHDQHEERIIVVVFLPWRTRFQHYMLRGAHPCKSTPGERSCNSFDLRSCCRSHCFHLSVALRVDFKNGPVPPCLHSRPGRNTLYSFTNLPVQRGF